MLLNLVVLLNAYLLHIDDLVVLESMHIFNIEFLAYSILFKLSYRKNKTFMIIYMLLII